MKKIFIISFIFFLFIFFISSYEEYAWPLPDYTEISSFFGSRISPITGKFSHHTGIDIPAPEETEIFSACSGKVVYLGFEGANGYTLKIKRNQTIFSYSHISPNFIVNVDDIVQKCQYIANIGPKYIENIPYNPYTDSSGNQTNGATTGCHLHFSIYINDELIDPLTIFPKIMNY